MEMDKRLQYMLVSFHLFLVKTRIINCYFLDHDQFFDGRVFGELNSDASIHLEDGVITGTIQFSDETYHIEV